MCHGPPVRPVTGEGDDIARAVLVGLLAGTMHCGDSVSVRREDGLSLVPERPNAATVGAHEKDGEVAPTSADVALKDDPRAVGAVIGVEVLSVRAKFRVTRLIGEHPGVSVPAIAALRTWRASSHPVGTGRGYGMGTGVTRMTTTEPRIVPQYPSANLASSDIMSAFGRDGPYRLVASLCVKAGILRCSYRARPVPYRPGYPTKASEHRWFTRTATWVRCRLSRPPGPARESGSTAPAAQSPHGRTSTASRSR
jgi:hypothetical protein